MNVMHVKSWAQNKCLGYARGAGCFDVEHLGSVLAYFAAITWARAGVVLVRLACYVEQTSLCDGYIAVEPAGRQLEDCTCRRIIRNCIRRI